MRAVRWRAVLVAVTAVFVLDALARTGAGRAGFGTVWGAGDLALYSVFLMVGFLHRDGALRGVSRRGWAAVAALATGAAIAWRLTQPVPLGVVNNSHPLHLFVGAAWLAVALAGAGALGRLAATRVAGGAIRAISRRSLTIYLWHTAAVIVALNTVELTGITAPVPRAAVLVLLTALGTLVAVQLFGWIEDVAARRPRPDQARYRPADLARPVLVLATLAALGGASVGIPIGRVGGTMAATASGRPPVPSRAPDPPTFTVDPGSPADAVGPGPVTGAAASALAARLDGLLAPWAAAAAVPGAIVGITGAGLRWSGAIGWRPGTGQAMSVADRIDVASLTKLYTANLVHRFAEAGLIDLAGPLPRLGSLPDFPYEDGITVDELLEHRSGLLSYGGTTLYLRDPEAVHDPVSAVMASVADPLIAKPGVAYSYSSTNYLVPSACCWSR